MTQQNEVLHGLIGWSVRFVEFNAKLAERLGLGAAELRCLYELSRHGPQTPGALARRVHLTTGAASRMVERLHAAGHVHRTPDPTDRRRVLVAADEVSIARVAARFAPLDARILTDLAALEEPALGALAAFLAAAERSTDAAIAELESELEAGVETTTVEPS